jgi:hypothetical protein
MLISVVYIYSFTLYFFVKFLNNYIIFLNFLGQPHTAGQPWLARGNTVVIPECIADNKQTELHRKKINKFMRLYRDLATVSFGYFTI